MTNVTRVDNRYSALNDYNRPLPKRYVEHPGYTEYVYETSPTKTSKWVSGLASSIITGLGQCINGEWGKGIAMFLGNGALILTGTLLSTKNLVIPILCGIGTFAVKLTSVIDAVKHAKSETIQIVPKDNTTQPNVNYSA